MMNGEVQPGPITVPIVTLAGLSNLTNRELYCRLFKFTLFTETTCGKVFTIRYIFCVMRVPFLSVHYLVILLQSSKEQGQSEGKMNSNKWRFDLIYCLIGHVLQC